MLSDFSPVNPEIPFYDRLATGVFSKSPNVMRLCSDWATLLTDLKSYFRNAVWAKLYPAQSVQCDII